MALIAPYTFWQALDNNGDPLAAGTINTYEAGTTTNKQTFTDSTEGTPNANPIVLDANGRANIWLDTGSYKFVIKDSGGSTLSTVDNITGDAANVFGSTVLSVSTNTNVTASQVNNVIDCTAALTLSLLDVASAAEGFVFAVKNSGSGDVILDPDGLELIDGASTLTLKPDQSLMVVCTGTAWLSLYLSEITAAADNEFTGDNTFTGTSAFSGAVSSSGGNTFTGDVIFPDDGELTIATGVITPTAVNHTVDTESDASTDDLDTITAGSDGQLLIIRPENTARSIVIKDGTGNIETPDGGDITLDNTEKSCELKYDLALTKWIIISSPNSGLLIQSVNTSSATVSSGTAQIPVDNTTPSSSEGLLALTRTITPTNSSNKLRIYGKVNVANASSNQQFTATLFVGTTFKDASVSGEVTAANKAASIPVDFTMTAGVTSELSFTIRVGGDSSSTTTINGVSGAALFGTGLTSTLTIEEIKV